MTDRGPAKRGHDAARRPHHRHGHAVAGAEQVEDVLPPALHRRVEWPMPQGDVAAEVGVRRRARKLPAVVAVERCCKECEADRIVVGAGCTGGYEIPAVPFHGFIEDEDGGMGVIAVEGVRLADLDAIPHGHEGRDTASVACVGKSVTSGLKHREFEAFRQGIIFLTHNSQSQQQIQ